jgi:hypothetical protein
VTEDELRHLEQRFGITLPDPYKAFMLEFPTVLLETRILVGDQPQTPAQWEFLGSVERLLEVNRFVREEPDIEWLEDGGAWPEDKFVIGEDIGGDYFALDLCADGAVLRFDHENGTLEPLEPTLQAYTTRVLREYAEYNQRRKTPE